MIQIIPAIDIIGGRCVRLTQGDYGRKKVYDADPVELVRRYCDCGVQRIHVVDLDGAKVSSPCNLDLLERLARTGSVPIEWGGGISGDEALQQVFDAGAGFAIIGTLAALQPERFAAWLQRYGDRMILGADLDGDAVAVKGWQQTVPIGIDTLLDRFIPEGLQEVICTDIRRDGMLQGPSTGLYTRLQGRYPDLSFTVSGGISGMQDIRTLDEAGLRKVIVGKAIYEGKITLEDIRTWSQNA